MAGMEMIEKTKLATMNWLVIALFPPERSVNIGIAVMGGIAACKRRIKAIG